MRCLLYLGLLWPMQVWADVDWLSRLQTAAPEANPQAVAAAIQALTCIDPQALGANGQRLALIDYSRPSTEKRLWVFDLQTGSMLWHEWVAHGQGSGGNFATDFSDDAGSHQSSLGMFRTADTYEGRNGYSLRLHGLDTGLNDHALERAIVMHGAPYVSAAIIRSMGRLGRSWGCPAVRNEVARDLIDDLKDGAYLFAYAGEQQPRGRCATAAAADNAVVVIPGSTPAHWPAIPSSNGPAANPRASPDSD